MPIRDEDLPKGIIRSKETAGPLAPAGGGTGESLPTDKPSSGPLARRGAVHSSTVGEDGGIGESRITALEEQQKRKGRVNVFIDSKFALGLFEDVVLTLGLRIGQQITPERLGEISQAETLRKAIEDAYNLLSFRSRAEKELSDRLQRKGYEENVIAQVVEKLRSAGYLNDETFARSWVQGRGKTLGRRALAHELRQKGVDKQTIADTLDAEKPEESEQDAARLAAVRKVGENPSDKSREARAKLAAFLQRRGFGWSAIRPVLTELYDTRDGAPDDTDLNDLGVENSDNESSGLNV